MAGENQTVNVTYNNLHVTATQAVNAAGIYELDAYDTIGINGADAFRVKGEEAVSIEANSIANGDQTYRFVIQTYSKNNAAFTVSLLPKTGLLRSWTIPSIYPA